MHIHQYIPSTNLQARENSYEERTECYETFLSDSRMVCTRWRDLWFVGFVGLSNLSEIRWRLRIVDAEPSSNFRHKKLTQHESYFSTRENKIPRKFIGELAKWSETSVSDVTESWKRKTNEYDTSYWIMTHMWCVRNYIVTSAKFQSDLPISREDLCPHNE